MAVDQDICDRLISEALDVAVVTTRLLRAWHSGEIDSQQSMKALWEAVGRIRQARPRESARSLPTGNTSRSRPEAQDPIETADVVDRIGGGKHSSRAAKELTK